MIVTEELGRALRTLVDESLGDWVYTIREREMQGWEGPRVLRFSAACEVIERTVRVYNEENPPVLAGGLDEA